MTKYILSENKLRKIINETIVNILTEELSDAYKQINDGMWKRTYGVRPNLNKKKWQRRFDRDSYIPEPLTDFEQDCEDAAEEFLNTPNAARDFKNFPRQSAHRNHDYFDYSNNRKLKLKRQENKQKRIEQDIQVIKSILRHIGLKLFKTCDITQVSKSDIAFIEKVREMDKTIYNNKIFPCNTLTSINWATALLSFSIANLPILLDNDKLRNLMRQASNESTKNNVTPQH